jgi:hypothetical protein
VCRSARWRSSWKIPWAGHLPSRQSDLSHKGGRHAHFLIEQSSSRASSGRFSSRSTSAWSWGVTSLSPAKGERMQKAQVKAGDLSGLLSRFALLQSKCWLRTKHDYPLVVIQEAGLDLFLPSWRFTVLQQLKGVGPTWAAILCRKDFSDTLTIEDSCPPTRPDAHTWQSGSISRERGISKAGNARMRTTMVQLSWLWLRHQPQSALARWFHDRTSGSGGRNRRVANIALARKLLVRDDVPLASRRPRGRGPRKLRH